MLTNDWHYTVRFYKLVYIMNTVVCFILEWVVNHPRLFACMVHISCITSPHDFYDMYTLALGPVAIRLRPLGLGVYIRQITRVHDATIT